MCRALARTAHVTQSGLSLTDADIAAGAATITGLTPETEYTAVMKRSNGLTRGTVTFTTAIELAPTDILVKEGESIVDAIKNAPEGYRLVVMPGEYAIPADEGSTSKYAAFNIDKPISIKGLRENDKPIIRGRFTLATGGSADFDQVILDGEGTSGDQAFVVLDKTAVHDHLNILNSEVRNFTKGFYYLNVAATINNVKIDNCIIHDIPCSGGDFLDARTGSVKVLSITNSTFYNCATECRNIVRDNKTDPTEVTIDHCTFVDALSKDNSDGKSYPFFNMQCKTGSVKFTNNILFNCVSTGTSSTNHKNTPTPTFDNNVYSENCKFKDWDKNGLVADPKFADASTGDFTVTNDNVKDTKAGDPRWQ